MESNSIINKQEQRQRILQKFKQSIKRRPLLCLALLFYWIWINLAYQGPLFFPASELVKDTVIPTWLLPTAISAITYFCLGTWFKKITRVVRQPWYVGIVAAMMTGGALLCFIWIESFDASLQGASPLFLYGIGSLGIGVGTACLLVEWGRVFGHLGPQEVLFHGIVAMLGSALFVSLLAFLPIFVGQIIYVAIPIPLAYCFIRSLKALPRTKLYEFGLNAKLYRPVKFWTTAFLHGLALGVLMGAFLLFDEGPEAILVNALRFVAAALLLLVSAVSVKMDFNHLIYQVGFSIMSFGALMIACFVHIPVIGESIQLVGFCYVHLIMWGLCSYLTKNFELPATWVVAWPTCFLMLGQIVGGVTGSIATQQPNAPYWIEIVFTVVVFILLMAALVMFSNRNLTTGWGVARPVSASGTEDATQSIIQIMGVENGLTPREMDIFVLLARGRNRKMISEKLTVSEETIKSHMQSIYRKLGVHSQQEVIDLVEKRVQEVGQTDESIPLL